MLSNELSNIIVKNRSKHIYITDTLLHYALKKFPLKKVLYTSRLCYYLEHTYWCIDDLVDTNLQKQEVYWRLFTQLKFTRLFYDNLMNLDISTKQKIELLDDLKSTEIDLWQLIEKEKEAKSMVKKDLEEAIYYILYGKGFHARIYITIFNKLLDTQQFNLYLPYRMLELLQKDLTIQDIEEDIIYNNSSTINLLLNKMKMDNSSQEELFEGIINVSKKLYNQIEDPYFKLKAKNILKKLDRSLKTLSLSKYYKLKQNVH